MRDRARSTGREGETETDNEKIARRGEGGGAHLGIDPVLGQVRFAITVEDGARAVFRHCVHLGVCVSVRARTCVCGGGRVRGRVFAYACVQVFA